MRIQIYCPECMKKGCLKHLMDADSNAVGVIYPYCKMCRRNVVVTLRPGQTPLPGSCHEKRPPAGTQ